jgi:hypothetical protein
MRLLQLPIQLLHLPPQLLHLPPRLLLLFPQRRLVLPLQLFHPALERLGLAKGGFGTGGVVGELGAEGVEFGLAGGGVEFFAALFVASEFLRRGTGEDNGGNGGE